MASVIDGAHVAYAIFQSIKRSIERVGENSRSAATLLNRIERNFSELQIFIKHSSSAICSDKFLIAALGNIVEEFQAAENMIRNLEATDGFTFKAWFRGSEIKKHLEEAEKQTDIALRHFLSLRQECNQRDIRNEIAQLRETTIAATNVKRQVEKRRSDMREDKLYLPKTSSYASKSSSWASKSLSQLRPNRSENDCQRKIGSTQLRTTGYTPVINLTLNISAEKLADDQEESRIALRLTSVPATKDKPRHQSSSRRLHDDLNSPHRFRDLLKRLDAKTKHSIIKNVPMSTLFRHDYPETRRRKRRDLKDAIDQANSDLTAVLELLCENPLAARELAGQLVMFSSHLHDIGSADVACEISRRAVTLLEKAGADESDRLYGYVLRHCSWCYGSVAKYSEALRLAQQAVMVFSRIAQNNTGEDKANADLAMALNALGYQLNCMGLIDEAVDACRRCVEIFRVLHYQSPEEHCADLALCMVNYTGCLRDLRMYSEAMQISNEAHSLYQRCYSVEPSVYGWEYGICLCSQTKCLVSDGRLRDALVTIRESIHIFRGLDAKSPEQFSGDLAIALLNCSEVYLEMRRKTEARIKITESLGHLRKLVIGNHNVFRQYLAVALRCSAKLYYKERSYTKADRDLQEALSIFSGGVRYVDKIYLVQALQLIAACRRKLKNYHNAKDYAQRAVDICRDLASQSPTHLYHKVQLAEALLELFRCRDALHLNDNVSLNLLTEVKGIYCFITSTQIRWSIKEMFKMGMGYYSLLKLQTSASQQYDAFRSVQEAIKYLEVVRVQCIDLRLEADLAQLLMMLSSLCTYFRYYGRALYNARRAVEMTNTLRKDDKQRNLLEAAKKRLKACEATIKDYYLLEKRRR